MARGQPAAWRRRDWRNGPVWDVSRVHGVVDFAGLSLGDAGVGAEEVQAERPVEVGRVPEARLKFDRGRQALIWITYSRLRKDECRSRRRNSLTVSIELARAADSDQVLTCVPGVWTELIRKTQRWKSRVGRVPEGKLVDSASARFARREP